ncbi:hypothetical protein [Nocardia spumae]|uniref:hypothetical protein n=1 Tax=Nocardia spumae TaxID=2887190 RepID=UPI001D14BF8C|nr:hypothetical protein [Nocardia spumae]
MTGSNPPHGGPEQPGQGNPPNETVHWWSTPAAPEQPLTGTDPTVMGGQAGVTGTDPTVLGAGFDAYHSGTQHPYPQQQQPSHPGYPQQPPPPSHPGYPQQQFPPPYGQQPGYPQPGKKNNNTPWIVGGVVGLVVVIGIVIGVIALTGGDGGSKGGSSTKKGVDGSYSMANVTNACSLIDPTVLRRWAPDPKDSPEHTERAPDSSYGGGNLSCRARYDGAGKYGSNGSDIDFEADFQSKYGDPEFNSWKNSDTKTTGSGRTSGDIAGIGSQAYYAAYQQDYSSFVTLDYTCAAIDSNVSAKVELRIQGEKSINTDDVATTCKDQLKKALAGLHK